MQILVDSIIGAGAFLAAAYCMLLSRRLRGLTRLDGDVGRAIAVLSQQVDALTAALKAAEQSNSQAGVALSEQVARANSAARHLELLMGAHQASHTVSPPRENERSSQEPALNHTDPRAATFETLDGLPHRTGRDARRRVSRQREQLGDIR